MLNQIVKDGYGYYMDQFENKRQYQRSELEDIRKHTFDPSRSRTYDATDKDSKDESFDRVSDLTNSNRVGLAP